MMSWPISMTRSSSVLDSQPGHSNGASDVHFSEKGGASEVPPIRVLRGPLLVRAGFRELCPRRRCDVAHAFFQVLG